MCVEQVAVLAVLLERGQRGALIRTPLAEELQVCEAPAHAGARDRARAPVGSCGRTGSRSAGARARRRAPCSAECSSESCCGWIPKPSHTGFSCARRAEQEAHPARHLLLEQERLGTLGIVVGGVDGDADDAHVGAPEVVERAADRLHLRRARVAAGRVDEREHDGLPAQRGGGDRVPVLVGQREVRHRLPRRAQRARPAVDELEPARRLATRGSASSTPATAAAAQSVRAISASWTRAGSTARRLDLKPRSDPAGSRSARAPRGRACRACAAGWPGATRRSSRPGAASRRSACW